MNIDQINKDILDGVNTALTKHGMATINTAGLVSLDLYIKHNEKPRMTMESLCAEKPKMLSPSHTIGTR